MFGAMTVIINFDPLQQTVSNHAGEVTLNRQSSLCLAYLLKHEDTFISKQELIEKCWAPRGVIVSEGSVRQVLFMLRRALNQLGAPDETLTTRSKVGYRLRAGIIQVTDLSDESLTATTSIPTFPPMTPHQNSTLSRCVRWRYVIVGFLIVIVMLVSGGFSLQRMFTKVEYLPSKKYFGGNVHVFYQRGVEVSLAEADLDAVFKWRNEGLIIFPQTAWIYVNRSEPQNVSVFICDNSLGLDRRKCISVSGLGREH